MKPQTWWKAKPVSGPDAFGRDDLEGQASQITVLLGLGRQLALMREYGAAKGKGLAAGAMAAQSGDQPVPPPPPAQTEAEIASKLKEDFATYSSNEIDIEIPQLKFETGVVGQLQAFGDEATRAIARDAASAEGSDTKRKKQHDLAGRVFARQEPDTAAELVLAELASDHEAVRIAAAAAAVLMDAHSPEVERILSAGATSGDPAIEPLARQALAMANPSHDLTKEWEAEGPGAPPGPPRGTSLLIHGTFARRQPWWQPGGDYHTYFGHEVRNDLYGGTDRYDWTGAYSHPARDLAARELVAWLEARRGPSSHPPILVAHSHGGTAAFLATHYGLEIDLLVLLSVPAHPARWLPDFSRVRRIVSFRVRNDWVILADGGRQRFSDPRIEEHILPMSFDHSATHYPDVWREHRLANRL